MDKQQKRFISNLRKAWRDEMVAPKLSLACGTGKKSGTQSDSRSNGASGRPSCRPVAEASAGAWRKNEYFRRIPGRMLRRHVLMKSSPETAAQMLETGEAEADKLYETMIAAQRTTPTVRLCWKHSAKKMLTA